MMLFTIVTGNGPWINLLMAKCTVLGMLDHEILIEDQPLKGLMSEVHSEFSTCSNGNDRSLGGTEKRT